jgi:hypothetical protein
MFRAGKLTSLAVGAACLIGAFTLSAPGLAIAATASPAAGGPIGLAALAAKPQTFTSQYSCDLSAYATGTSPVTLSATVTFPASVQAISPLDITLNTTAASLPSGVLSKLTGVTSFDLSGSLTAKEAGQTASVPLHGSIPVSGTLTGVPAGKATGSVSFPTAGAGAIEVPAPTLTLTPNTGTTALAAITCTAKAAAKDIAVTVTPQVIGTKGPLYKCDISLLDLTSVALIHMPMTVTSSGSRTTGQTDTVTLVAGTGPYPSDSTSIKFSADLPVTGAQPGKIAVTGTVTNLNSSLTRASGKLHLTKAGTDRILVPEKFTLKFDLESSGVIIPVAFACAIQTHPVPVGLTLKVTKGHTQPHPTTSPTPTSTATGNGGQPEGSGTPSGAPETGGGTGPGADMAAAAGGAAIVVSGGGLVLFGRRRTRAKAGTRPGDRKRAR